ncbi:MAG TPA: LuxR C-terminal-related transcriptional regulator [Burkholderiaceae bacterium]|nr:LuxR C-terminal-related transcriptional regulator [Burkholderiaceae bacterium]
MPRSALVDAVVQSPARLVLVRAPAGFGKTTLMAQVRQRLMAAGIATAWLTLDSADNDPSRFLAYLARALDELLPQEGGLDPAIVPGTPLGEVALALMERASALQFPFAFFVDELEVVRSPGVMALLTQLLESVPVGARLVIGSRTVPDLRLARLRASRQLLEIGVHKLRFSLDETRQFFATLGSQPLGNEELGILHAKTEGWAAALWLASLTIERHEHRRDWIVSFSGTEENLAEYLAEEVLAQQPPEIRRLLLATSILREVSAPLCAALLPGMDSESILRQLASANVFLMPIDGRPGHWRYHSLFASFLIAQLQRQPAEVPQLHRAAAGWFIAQGRPVPAVDHYIAAGEVTRAVEVLQHEAMPLLMQGRLRLLTRWFDALPPAALREHPLLQVVYLWSTCFTRGPQAGLALMRTTGIERSADPEVKVHVAALQAAMLALLDRWEEAHAVGARSMHLLPSGSAYANGALVNVTASSAVVLGLFPEARQLLERARQVQGQAVSPFHRMYSETIEGMIDLIEGRLREARARFHLAVQSSQNASLDTAQGNAWAGLLYAASVYEADDLRQARRLLQVYLPLARDAWLPDHVILGYRLLSRIAFAEGEIDHAFQGLSELEYLGHERQLPRLAAAARLERARLLLLQGHHGAAAHELRSAGTPEIWRQVGARRHLGHEWEDPEIGLLRWEALAGDPRRAAAALEAAAALARRNGRVRRAFKLRLLHAVALARAGDDDGAQDLLMQVLQAGCAEGVVRMVLDEGEPMARLVAHAQAALDPSQTGPLFADYLQRLRAAFGPLAADDPASAVPVPLPRLMEALTPKEIRLLQLLAEGYSNRAMTEKLFVSDSTVRTHLRNINGKLGANSRTQAVAIARRLGLIR